MTSYVPAALRRFVSERADGLCEYCLMHEDQTYFGCQVEHVIAEKHGGPTTPENLAYACVFCNRFKGSDIATVDNATGQLVRLYNPRTDRWSEHFKLDRVRLTIDPASGIGAATAKLLNFNHPDRLAERQLLAVVGSYPPTSALVRINERS
jgi:hypothetical protein